mmetsp:Transcript_5827/g.13773  ORF Transcript_5827/g.13773 Transcript_5827/m.13773 type:complete len:518 (-) Transcript_5827:109-1662(-)
MGDQSGSDDDSSEHSGNYVPAARKDPLPEAVDYFLGELLKGLQTRNISMIHTLYEDTFNKLTEKHYKTLRWPHVDRVKEDVSDEPLFLILYQELYYRHIFSRLTPTFEDRRRSWENYCKLLDLIIDDLSSGEDLAVALPPQWVWDLLDEFIYHYQTYCNFRNKAVKKQGEKEMQEIRDNPEVFGTPKVLSYLHQLIKTSGIKEYLADPENAKGLSGGAFKDETTRLFGYFGLMQLLRMHSLLADYHLAMQTIEVIDFDAEVPLFYKIPACHVTLFYYMGFAYLMLRRYFDAIKTFSDILVFLSKTSGVNSLSYQYDQMVKKQDQMYALLLICMALCPRPVDESLEKTMRDKHGEKQAKLQRGEELCFEECFSYACPKFISAALPDFDRTENFDPNEAHKRQLHLFLQEVKEQQFLPRIGSYMKLYTAITTSKLAQLCEMDAEGLRDQLMCVMHKTQQRVRQKGPPLEGEPQLCSEVEFYLDGDMVHINAQRVERPHSEVFLEQILKFQDLLRKMGKA